MTDPFPFRHWPEDSPKMDHHFHKDLPDPDVFLKAAKAAVAEAYNREEDHLGDRDLEWPGFMLQPEDLYIVWFVKVLQNWKALLSTDRVHSGVYWEVTHNGDKGETYVDFYTKQSNTLIGS